jgi:signal transduction histidine kinase
MKEARSIITPIGRLAAGTPALPDAPGWAGVRGFAGQLITGGACLLAYVLLEWISFVHEYKNMPVTAWNPGLGLVFGLIVLGGPRYALVLFAGVVIAEITVLKTNLAWPIILAIAAVCAGVYSLVAKVARNYLKLDVDLYQLRDVVILLAAAASGAFLVSALLSALLMLNGQLGWADVAVAAVPLLVGDIIGIGVVTPLMLRIARHGREMLTIHPSTLVPELVLYTGLFAAALWIIVGAGPDSGFKFFYLLFVPVVVATVRYGMDGACISLAVAQLGLVGVLHTFGMDARAFTELQTLMLVLSATGLTVGAVVSERQTADRLVRAAETQLREKQAEAVRATRFSLVSGMASALAHEINQPMTAVRALARSVQHILRAPDVDLARADANLSTLIGQIDHATGVVRRMREFLRRGHPHVSTIDVAAMLDEALMLVRAEAAAKHVDIATQTTGSLPDVHGDRIQLQQVVLNLVRNAVDAIAEAGQQDGTIRVSAQRSDQPPGIEIAVRDNGPGIAADVADSLFVPLTTSKREGLGLGLSISAAIAEAHGGRVWLHSHQPGATEFRLWLPLGTREAH